MKFMAARDLSEEIISYYEKGKYDENSERLVKSIL
jgi:hypothetical protein